MRYLNLIILLLVFCSIASAQPRKYRSAIFLHQSTGNAYWYGTDAWICTMGSAPSCNAIVNLPVQLAIYNKQYGLKGTDSCKLSHAAAPVTGGSPLGAENSIAYWYGTFTRASGYESQYTALHAYRSTYSVIVIKECYAWYNYDTDGKLTTDIARARVITDSMKQYPGTFWVWWTPASHHYTQLNTTSAREKHFADWMKDTLAAGLDLYGAFPKNIFIFDYFNYSSDSLGEMLRPFECCSTACGVPYDSHPNCDAVNALTPIMINEWFGASRYYENIHIANEKTHGMPRNLKMAFHATNPWDMARADLVIGWIQDSVKLAEAKAYNSNNYILPTRDLWGGGAFAGESFIGRLHAYRTFNASGGVINYGSNPQSNWSEYCSTYASKGRFIEYEPDSANDMIQNTLFDGWHSDNGNIPAFSLPPDWDRNGVTDDNYTITSRSLAGWNTHARNYRRNYGSGSSLAGGDTSLNQKLILRWTYYPYYNCDTALKSWINGWGIENPTGSNTAGTGNGWDNAAGNPFQSLLDKTRNWDRVATYKPSFFYMTVIMDDSRGDMCDRDSLMKARWALGMWSLTKIYGTLHDDDATGMDHSSWVWYDEMESELGQMNPDTVYRLSSLGNYVWVAFYDSGAVIFRSGEDYATAATRTVSVSDISGLYGYAGPYYHPWGNQDTVRNNGQQFTSVVLRAKTGGTSAVPYRGDAQFLFKHRDTLITPVIVDNALYPTSAQCQPATLVGFSVDVGADNRTPATTYTNNPATSGIYLNPTYSDACWQTTGTPWPQVYRQHYAAGSGSPTTETATATFVPKLNRTGYWSLYRWNGYRGINSGDYAEAESTKCTISRANGDTVVYIHQDENIGQWNLVGTFPYTAGQSYPVVVSNINVPTNRYVLADAWMWVWGYGADISPPEEPPAPPTLNSPCGSYNIPIRPTFYWSSSPGATSYRIQVSLYQNFSSLVIDQSGITATNYTPSINLNYSTVYYWRVNASNIYGSSDWSTSCLFTTTSTTITKRNFLIIRVR